MRQTRTAVRGLLPLFAALSLCSCSSSGPDTVPVPTVVEIPRPVPITVPSSFTDPPMLPALPTPAFRDQGVCAEGCFTNGQVRDILDAVLGAYQRAVNQLHAIMVYSAERARQIEQSNNPPPPQQRQP